MPAKSKRKKILEGDIKAALIQHFRDQSSTFKNTTIINELTVNLLSRRADLVFVNGDTQVFEIKSEADQLGRLIGQTDTYLRFFDKVTIVAASKHIAEILDSTPKHVAVWEMLGPTFKVHRRGQKKIIKDKSSLIRLMTASELKKTLSKVGVVASLKRRLELEVAVADLSVQLIRRQAIVSLKSRYEKSTKLFWSKVRNSTVKPKHVKFLSPFYKNRVAIEKQKEKHEAMLETWGVKVEEASDDSHLKEWAEANSLEPLGPVPEHIKDLISA
jgi:hypothetical protein